MGRGAERTAVDLGQPERGVFARDDDVGVAGQADSAAEAEPVNRCDYGDLALVDRGKGGRAPAAHLDQSGEVLAGPELLDVDAGIEAATLGAENNRPHGRIVAESAHRPGEQEPASCRQRVHWRMIHHALGDSVRANRRTDHGWSPSLASAREPSSCTSRTAASPRPPNPARMDSACETIRSIS